MKYNLKFKLECIRKYKEDISDFTPLGISKGSFMKRVRSWIKIFDDLCIDGLKHKPSNKEWSIEQKFELITKV